MNISCFPLKCLSLRLDMVVNVHNPRAWEGEVEKLQ